MDDASLSHRVICVQGQSFNESKSSQLYTLEVFKVTSKPSLYMRLAQNLALNQFE